LQRIAAHAGNLRLSPASTPRIRGIPEEAEPSHHLNALTFGKMSAVSCPLRR
jgi:hypothetical protein